MKLDKIKFAKLVQYITNLNHQNYLELDVLDDLIDIDVPEASALNHETLHVLMALMAAGTQKIEAIKQHRMLTGYVLKDSKDIVEKYWPDSNKWSKSELMNKIDNNPPNADYLAIRTFINNL